MIVYTGGSFDLFHYGHARFLARCAEIGSVTVALNTDEFIAEYKGRPPIVPYQGRAEVLRACRYVDEVVPNTGGADSKPTIEQVAPDIIAIGSDWQERDYHLQMGFSPAWLADHRITLLYLPYTDGISSSAIREQL